MVATTPPPATTTPAAWKAREQAVYDDIVALDADKANDADVVHDTGAETIAGVKTFSSDPIIPDEAYGVGWDGSLEPPTKNAVYDKIETIPSLSFTPASYTPTWAGGTAPSLGNGVLTGRSVDLGTFGWFQIYLEFGTTTTGGTGTWTFSLPAGWTAASGRRQMVSASASDASVGRYNGHGVVSAGGTTVALVVLSNDTAGSSAISATTPFTWVSTDYLMISGWIETT